MRLIRKLSFVFILILTFFISHSFACAEDGYKDDEIWIKDVLYKNVETEFQGLTPEEGVYNYNSDLPYLYYDESGNLIEGSFPDLDGQTIVPTIVCDDPSGTNCYSMGVPGTAIGDPVYGEYFGESDLWQKVDINGQIYYVPVGGVDGGSVAKYDANSYYEAGSIKNYGIEHEKNAPFEINVDKYIWTVNDKGGYILQKYKTDTADKYGGGPGTVYLTDSLVNPEGFTTKSTTPYIEDKGWWGKTLGYLKDSGDQIIRGNYTDKVNVLGTAGQIATGFFGVDAAGDVRDLAYDFQHWEWSWKHAGGTLLDGIGLIPVVGIMKNVDEVAALVKKIPVSKIADTGKKVISSLSSATKKAVSNVTSAAVSKVSDTISKTKNTIASAGTSIKNGLSKLKFWKKTSEVKIGNQEISSNKLNDITPNFSPKQDIIKVSPHKLKPTETPDPARVKQVQKWIDQFGFSKKESIKYYEYENEKYIMNGHHRQQAAKNLNIDVYAKGVDVDYLKKLWKDKNIKEADIVQKIKDFYKK